MKNCCVCEQSNSNYKCPTCRKHYCCLDCCKKHKAAGCDPPTVEATTEPIVTAKYSFPTGDTVPKEKLEFLRHSDEVKECLNNPHVRDICRAILNNPDPSRIIALAMTEPIFVELADACLKVVEPQNDHSS